MVDFNGTVHFLSAILMLSCIGLLQASMYFKRVKIKMVLLQGQSVC